MKTEPAPLPWTHDYGKIRDATGRVIAGLPLELHGDPNWPVNRELIVKCVNHFPEAVVRLQELIKSMRRAEEYLAPETPHATTDDIRNDRIVAELFLKELEEEKE